MGPQPRHSTQPQFTPQAHHGAALILAALALLPVLLFGRIGLRPLWGLAGYAVTVAWIRSDLGGMSGDISGAGITVGELCALLALTLA